MNKHTIYAKILLIILLSLVIGISLAAGQSAEPQVIADFEQGIPYIEDADHVVSGFIPWGSDFENVVLAARQIPPFGVLSLPDSEPAANTVLMVQYDIRSGGWGGFTHALTDGAGWISADWRDYNALRFWLTGNGTGKTVQVDLFDNRNLRIAGDTAERYYYRITDDYTGWRQFTIPFDLFQRRTDFQPSGAPNDGLGLDQVSGYAFGFPGGVGAQTALVDQVEIVTADDTTQVTMQGGEAGIVTTTEEGATVEESKETLAEAVPLDSERWQLLWSDEFEGAAGTPIDTNFWTCETGGEGWGNNEHEFYTDRVENVSLDGNSSLAIVARQETLPDSQCWYGECLYTSARCITKGKFEFQYGRVEARMKLPYGQGIWPAFWMLGGNFDDVGWPNAGEIDIMEFIGKEPNSVYGTIHGPNYSGGSGIGGSTVFDQPVSDDFHTFAIQWDESGIHWYIDGERFLAIPKSAVGGREWVFDHDFFLLLNLAVGGNWPGYPDASTIFPQTLLVDYVRVYQLAD